MCVTALLLTGCSASTPEQLAEPRSTSSPTPTIDPGPIELTSDQAADRYLSIVCQRNIANAVMNDAFVAQEDVFLNGEEADITAIKAAATEAMRINRLSVELIDDAYFTWPNDLGSHLKKIRDSQIAQMSMYDGIINATRYEDAYYTTAPDSSEASAAAQEIRYQLGLSSDTTVSCQGFETATDVAHAEMLERNEYLASFADDSGA